MDDKLKKQVEELLAGAGGLPDTDKPDEGKNFREVLNTDKPDEWMKDRDKEAQNFVNEHAEFFDGMTKQFVAEKASSLLIPAVVLPNMGEDLGRLFKLAFTLGYISGIVLTEQKEV